ncbi:TPA: avidin/streptavidin family protein [Legionella pneumophila]|uniref:avidin/streptavidin family protein n=1 Tax=Legionella pneumophila TaxID=446 RepID=UPI000770ACA0|nr:avidin/streptavidin family protein [Legionella pneumophila]MCW8429315.1 avidin/streptavidin family protein [Legionella pneumophila]CZG21267.1 Avidin family [Legionella pneumophila]CZG42190.1 Avidin family [Legionella pneumophila]
MKIKWLCSNVFIVSSLVSLPNYAQQDVLTFKNTRGSILELKTLSDNKVEGYFTTAVASKSCPQAIGQKRPITGYAVGNTVTFSVVYPGCGSVLSFSGNFTKKGNIIDTISILTHQAQDITHEGPGARFIGHDRFKKIAASNA